MKLKLFFFQFCILLAPFFITAQTDTSSYSVFMKGTNKGTQKIWKTDANTYHYFYQLFDRGRGDSLLTTAKTSNNGLITYLDITGVSYFRAAYKEQFSIQGDSAVWTVNGKRTAKKFNNELYISNTTPAIYELQIKAALKNPANRIQTVNNSFLHVADPVKKSIFTAKNQIVNLLLVPLYNEPSTIPTYIWLTEDMHFFAKLDGWYNVINQDYKELIDTLLNAQELNDQKYSEKNLKENSNTLNKRMIFKNVNLFNSSKATVEKNMSIEVVEGKISNIYSSELKNLPLADTVIDCQGKFLMPGLWEMHGHYFKEYGPFYLAGGVTHLRDMGNEKVIFSYKKQIEENKLIGPDISYLSLLLDRACDFQCPTGKIVTSLEEGMNAIDEYKRLGYQQLKIYSSIKPEWVEPLASHAHKLNMRVAGHVPMGMRAEQCVNKGFDELTHINLILLNFMPDSLSKLKSTMRFKFVVENTLKLDWRSNQVHDFITLMKDKHIVVDPTMSFWEMLCEESNGDTLHYFKPVAKWVPEASRSIILNQAAMNDGSNKPLYHASFNHTLELIKLLYDNGIQLVAGTDLNDPNALHHELELYVKAGIPANEVLKIATYAAAADCNLQEKYGQVKVGQLADFIIIDGDPTKNIGDIRKVETVVKNNRIYKPKKLLASQGWSYFY